MIVISVLPNSYGSNNFNVSIQAKVDQDSINMNLNYLGEKLAINLSGITSVSNGSHFFLFGGTNNSWNALHSIYIGDFQTFTFQKLAIELPAPRYGFGVAKIENKVYLIGGVHKLEADQRLKVISITNGGIDVLYCIYTRLDNYFTK